jgi:hypothetical protein
MINKFGEILFDESKIARYQKISTITMIIGLFMIIAYPYLTNKIYIVEKELKSSEFFYNQITKDFFIKTVEDYKQLKISSYDDFVKIATEQFKNTKIEDTVLSSDIISQRGERQKMLLINFIYDSQSGGRNMFLMYTLLRHFSNRSNYHWLSKDIRVNFISRELFYNNPKDFMQHMKDNKDYHKFKVDFVLNFDIQHDLSEVKLFEIGINGANSESVDMDFYKVFYENLNNNFKFTTNRQDLFTKRNRKSLVNIFTSIDEMLQNFSPLFPEGGKNISSYAESYIYFLENLISNYFLALGDINLNHLLISNNINSILVKTVSKERGETTGGIQEYKASYSQDLINQSFIFITAVERIVKNLSRNESDIFRGENNYLLSSPHTFANVAFILIILVLLTLKSFYTIIEYSQKINFDKINVAKIISYLTVMISGYFTMFLEIKFINFHLFDSYLETFYLTILAAVVFSFILFDFMKLNQDEYNFISTLLTFIIVLNCFTILFLNFGIGLTMSVIFMTTESTKLDDKRACLRHIVLYGGISYFLLFFNTEYIVNIVEMFVVHLNSVYFFLSLVVVYLSLRLGLAFAKLKTLS